MVLSRHYQEALVTGTMMRDLDDDNRVQWPSATSPHFNALLPLGLPVA